MIEGGRSRRRSCLQDVAPGGTGIKDEEDPVLGGTGPEDNAPSGVRGSGCGMGGMDGGVAVPSSGGDGTAGMEVLPSGSCRTGCGTCCRMTLSRIKNIAESWSVDKAR